MTKKKVRSPELQARINRTKEEARTDIAKRGTMHFRIDEGDVKRIYERAESANKAPSAMVREWVLERLNGVTQDPELTQRIATLESIISKYGITLSSGKVSECPADYLAKNVPDCNSDSFISIEISRSAIERLSQNQDETIRLVVPIFPK